MGKDKENQTIQRLEANLRKWFIRGSDPIHQTIDGLDIGWGGVQRWATAMMPALGRGLHLDVACGYATFLAQLGWRFPQAGLVGLNIDFQGPHALARPLLEEAGVSAVLVQADARYIPIADGIFDSASCFLGLQDIEIGFDRAGVLNTLTEIVRILRPAGFMVLLEEYPIQRFKTLLDGLSVRWVRNMEQSLRVRWSREVALRAIQLYANGFVTQMRLPEGDCCARAAAYTETLKRLQTEVEVQIKKQGYFVPFGPVRMVFARKC
jgi:SAM-dependent methyltransferase